MIIRILSFTLVIIVLISCSSSTQMTDVYVDKTFSGKEMKKILVLGLAKDEWKRKVYENEFRTRLLAHNVEVLVAWQELPKGEKLNKETFEKYFKDKNVEGVLVVMEGGESTDQTLYKGGSSNVYVGFYGFYVSSVPFYYNADYLAEEKIVHMRANLYETTDAKLIWSARSQSYEPKSTKDVIQKVSSGVVNDLYLQGFIK